MLHILTGAGTVTALIILFAIGYRAPADDAGDGYIVTAEFGAIDGVSTGSQVVLAGLPAGKVVDIGLNPENNRPRLSIALRPEIEVPFDSSIKIVSDGLAGPKYLKIVPGAEFDMMEPGDPFEYTQSSVLLEELLEKVIAGAEAKRAAKQEPEEQAE